MMPPNNMFCQQCPYREIALEKEKHSKSAFWAFLDAFDNANKKAALENGIYDAALREVLEKWFKRHEWKLEDVEKQALIEDIKNIKV